MEIKSRPALPWYLEDAVHNDNAFLAFKTPAGVLAYIYTELGPEVVAELIAGIIDAGASQMSLIRDAIELIEMGHDKLAEQMVEASEDAPIKPMRMAKTDFLPKSMKGADEVVLRAVAAVTKMKLRERMEGLSDETKAMVTAFEGRIKDAGLSGELEANDEHQG
jgi:hypothetical protein